MKTLFTVSALALGLFSTAAFAHHPAADRVDPEIYAMIDENVSDTPHADLVFDDMGQPSGTPGEDMAEAAEAAETGMGARSGMDMEAAMEQRGELPDVSDAMDTMTMLEDLDGRLE